MIELKSLTLVMSLLITFASDETIIVEKHPACAASASQVIIEELGLTCLPSTNAYRDTLFKGDFE